MVLKTYCELPNHGIYIDPQGRITSCCVSMYDVFGNINNESCEDIWHNKKANKFRKQFAKGKLPKSCIECTRNNESIRKSKSHRIKNLKTENSKIVHADITLGNMCQLSCTMCGPIFSHTWAKLQNKNDYIWYLSKEKMYEILNTIKGVKDVEIKGGEPFFMPYFDEFISKLHSDNPDVGVSIVSNGLHINKSHLEQLKKLKKVNISFSVEATGELYQYIRGGEYKFSNLLENIKFFKQYLNLKHIHISSTLSFYNITKWVEQHQELQNVLQDELNLSVSFSCNVVTTPINQSVFLVKKSVREKWLNDLKGSSINLDDKKYLHILENRVLDVSNEEILEKIKYFNKIRSMQLEKIVPNILDTLDEKYI